MPLARVKVWNPGDTLTAADLNAEYNNVLNNPITLVSPTTGAINFQTSVAHTNLTPSAITASSGTSGNALTISGASALWGSPAGGAGSRVKNLVGTLSSQTGTFTADEYLLRTTGGGASFILNSTASFTVNLGTSGPAANGRDQAGVFASTFIHWYVISTGFNSTAPAGVVSSVAPPTGPSLPTSYSAWAYLGTSPYSSASTTITNPQRQLGGWVAYEAFQNVLASGTATVETTVPLSSGQVPAIALTFQIHNQYNFQPSVGVSEGTADVRVVSGSNAFRDHLIGPGSGPQLYSVTSATLPNVGQQLFYILTVVQGAPSPHALSIDVMGYSVPNGDV